MKINDIIIFQPRTKLNYLSIICVLFSASSVLFLSNFSDLNKILEINQYKKFNEYLVKQVSTLGGYPNTILLSGMVLGYKKDLDNKLKNTLKDLGLVHIVVVSGYNIGLLANFVQNLLEVLFPFIKNRVTYVICILILTIYILIVGLEAPSIRALIMWAMINFGKLSGRDTNVLYSIFFTGFVMFLVRSEWVTELSFQLSFLATAGLALYSNKIEGFIKQRLKMTYNRFFSLGGINYLPKITKNISSVFISDLSASISATVLVWPLISFHFGRVSILAPLINGLLLWCVPYATFLGVVGVLAYFVVPIVGYLVFFVSFRFLDIFIVGVRSLSLLSFTNLHFEISFWMLLLYYILIFVSVVWRTFISRKVYESERA